MADSAASEPVAAAPRPFVEFRPLLRALGIASDSKKILLATLGLFALWAGWSLLAKLFDQPSPWLLPIPLELDVRSFFNPSGEGFGRVSELVVEPFRVVVAPFVSLFFPETGPFRWFQTALMAFWAIFVWGIVGGAITRIAVVQASGDHQVGLFTAVKFALRKSISLVGAPLTPLFGVALFAAGCALFGVCSRLPWGIGSTFAAIFGFVPLILGLVMALILLGLALGWPLMVATVAAEGEDAPDALSRAYSYVNQRLSRYLVHSALIWLIGLVGFMIVVAFANVVVGLADWGVGLGAGSSSGPLEGRAFWRGAVGLLVHGWVYSYFWSATSNLYLILRRDVDGTSWYDVYMPEQDSETFAGALDLPPTEKIEEVTAQRG